MSIKRFRRFYPVTACPENKGINASIIHEKTLLSLLLIFFSLKLLSFCWQCWCWDSCGGSRTEPVQHITGTRLFRGCSYYLRRMESYELFSGLLFVYYAETDL